MATPNKLPGPALMIKTEPGTSRSPSLRLPSFKPPRDMMLGGPLPNVDIRSSRKVYVPNLNVQRKKNIEDVAVKVEQNVTRGIADHKGGRGRGERGGRKKNDLLQSTGSVFSDGIAKDARPKRESKYGESGGGGGGSGSSSSGIRSFKTDSRVDNIMSGEKETEEKLAYLLQDNFIDDPDVFPGEDSMPRQLPTLKFKTEKPIKKEAQGKAKVVINGVKVKQEEPDGLTTPALPEVQEIVTFPQLFRSTSPKLILIKLPHGLVTPDSNPSETSRPSTSLTPTEEVEGKASSQGCNLPEGRVGTMQLMKSGQVRLLVGDHIFNSELGAYTNMKQDVMVLNVHPNGTGGDSINLGPIDAHIVSSRVTLNSPYFNPGVKNTMKVETK